jgi:hypothetical protein
MSKTSVLSTLVESCQITEHLKIGGILEARRVHLGELPTALKRFSQAQCGTWGSLRSGTVLFTTGLAHRYVPNK